MRLFKFLFCLFAVGACRSPEAYPVRGQVVERLSPTSLLIDHEAIPGLMGAMVMPFDGENAHLFEAVTVGDLVESRLEMRDGRGILTSLTVVGHRDVQAVLPSAKSPVLAIGEVLSSTLMGDGGSGTVVIGGPQPLRTAVTFLYTRCPLPQMCPATVSRLQRLQHELGGVAQLVAITLDPSHDTPEVLAGFSAEVGADPKTWRFARPTHKQLAEIALKAGLRVAPEGVQIAHGTRWLILDTDGRLIERYDDNAFPMSRVIGQLKTALPKGDPQLLGTLTLSDHL